MGEDNIDKKLEKLGWIKNYHHSPINKNVIGIFYSKGENSISYIFDNDEISITNSVENPIDINYAEFKTVVNLITKKVDILRMIDNSIYNEK